MSWASWSEHRSPKEHYHWWPGVSFESGGQIAVPIQGIAPAAAVEALW